MKIAFVTTQSKQGSTVIGRVLPLAKQLAARQHTVHVLVHGPADDSSLIRFHSIGKDPFTHTRSGKARAAGWQLVALILANTWRTLKTLIAIKPDAVVIVKPLPQNVLATWLWHTANRRKKIILDVDDLELTANVLTTLWQRMAVHWSERVGSALAAHIVCASPFLADHFTQLTKGQRQISHIPTGTPSELVALAIPSISTPTEQTPTLLYLGSLSVSSGHRVDLLPLILTEVRKEVPDAKLYLAGSGDNMAELKQQLKAQNMAHYVKWFGRFNQDDIPFLLQHTSILIDPVDASISNRAKSSYRVAVAAATGTAIVTSDIGIRPYFLPGSLHDKFFASPANVEDYAQKIISLLRHPLTTQDKAAMRRHAQRYTWDVLAQKYHSILTPRTP